MIIAAVSASHKTAPLEFLEKVAVSSEHLPKVLLDFWGRDHISEVVVLSTCMRTEIYLVAERFHPAVECVYEFLSAQAGISTDEISNYTVELNDDEAIIHLFQVASGLDSVVLGETEVLRQVRDAFTRATEERSLGPTLSTLFRHALETGKRARTETEIARGSASIASASVDLVKKHVPHLHGAEILVLGAGEMGNGVVTSLHRSGATNINVVNRTEKRASDLAQQFDAQHFSLSDLPALLDSADVIVSALQTEEAIIDVDQISALKRDKALLILDTSVPRSIEPAVGDLADVTLLNLTDLTQFVQQTTTRRALQANQVEEIVEEETARYHGVSAARSVAPVVTAIRAQAEQIRLAEVFRHQSQLRDLTDEQRETVDKLTKAIVAKLMHTPTTKLKNWAGTIRGERLVDSAYELFDATVEEE